MNFFAKYLKITLVTGCLGLWAVNVWSQPFSKQRVHEMVQTAIHNKVKTDIEKVIQQADQWKKNQIPNAENTSQGRITFRDDDAGISLSLIHI